MDLITGEAVTVIYPQIELDELSEPVEYEPYTETVNNVLVAPGATKDLDESRPNGVTIAFTLCFPKTYTEPLRGCSVEVRGSVYEVIGNPQPYTEANCPTSWNYTVEVKQVEG